MAKYTLTFASAHKVLKAESVLKKKETPFRLAPAPAVLAAYCELVITLQEDCLEEALKTLEEARVSPVSVYRKENGEYVKM